MTDNPVVPASTLPRRIAAAVTLCVVAVVAAQMAALDTNASLYLSFGEDSVETLEYGREHLGDVYAKPNLGHDGRFFYIAAHDPFITDPVEYEELFHRPVYRAQRVLLPLLAAPALVAGEWALVWWMLVINVLAIVGGTYATARLALAVGLSPWFGLAFTLNPGIWAELNAGSAGALAWALAVGGVLMYLEGRDRSALGLLVSAVLAREAMLLVVAGLAFDAWRRNRRVPVWMSVPFVAAFLWGLFVRIRLGEALWSSESEEFGIPLAGIIGAARQWITDSDPVRFVTALVFVVILIRFAALVRRHPHTLGWSVMGFVLIAPFLSRQVWYNTWDISRAVLPVVTMFVLLAGLEIQASRSRQQNSFQAAD